MNHSEKLAKFVALLEADTNSRLTQQNPNYKVNICVENGRKFDKVFENNGTSKHARYMVDIRTGDIFGVKSWTQVNTRRQYGTLDTIEQWNWGTFYATPKVGSQAEAAFIAREDSIKNGYKKRGRPRKIVV